MTDSFSWGDVPDVRVDDRGNVIYEDPGAESTALMWDSWREWRNARARAAKLAEEASQDSVFKNHETPTITLEAEEFDDPIPALARVVKLGVGSGFNIVELSHSKCHAVGKVIKSGERMGSRHPDRDIETQWVKLEKEGRGRALVSYTIVNDKVDSTATYRSFNGTVRSDAEMKTLLGGGK